MCENFFLNKKIHALIYDLLYNILIKNLQTVDVKEIYDKFPQKTGGLKELYEKGPTNAFFLVKFWADLNTNVQNDSGAFYGVSSK